MKQYRKKFFLFRNQEVTKEIRSLDPVKDHCRILHLLTGYEFPWDAVRTLEVALMHTFCSPAVSHLLHRTGEFRNMDKKIRRYRASCRGIYAEQV
jgi:hypothetical protein